MTVKRWAIDTKGLGLLGLFWFAPEGGPFSVPIALFVTRREAKAALVDVRKGFPQASIVRVTVSVEVVA